MFRNDSFYLIYIKDKASIQYFTMTDKQADNFMDSVSKYGTFLCKGSILNTIKDKSILHNNGEYKEC